MFLNNANFFGNFDEFSTFQNSHDKQISYVLTDNWDSWNLGFTYIHALAE